MNQPDFKKFLSDFILAKCYARLASTLAISTISSLITEEMTGTFHFLIAVTLVSFFFTLVSSLVKNGVNKSNPNFAVSFDKGFY